MLKARSATLCLGIVALLMSHGLAQDRTSARKSTSRKTTTRKATANHLPGFDIVSRDYDGDGKADFAIRLKRGQWLIDYSRNGLGSWDEKIKERAPGATSRATARPRDYDGDGKADLAIFLDSRELCIDYAKNGFGKWDVIRSYEIPGLPTKSTPRDLSEAKTNRKPTTAAARRRAIDKRRADSRARRDRTRNFAGRGRNALKAVQEEFSKAGLGNFLGGNTKGGPLNIIVNGHDHEVELLVVAKPTGGNRRVVNGKAQMVQIRVAKSQRVIILVNGHRNQVKIPRVLINNVTSKVNGNGNRVRYTK